MAASFKEPIMSNTIKSALVVALVAIISLLTAWKTELTSFGESGPVATVDTSNVIPPTIANNATVADVLGVVYTPAHEDQMSAMNLKMGEAAQHARYMANGYRLLENERTPWPELLPATLTDGHVWGNPENSTRALLDRLVKLRKVHAGKISVVVEFFLGEGWPWKGPMPENTGGDTPADYERFGYNVTKAVLLTMHELEGEFTYEFMGELWRRSKLPVRDAYLRGSARAYDEYATEYGNDKIKPATGALQYTNGIVSWTGELLAESIKDYPAYVLAIVNKWHGSTSINFYPSGSVSGFARPDELATSKDWNELPSLLEWLGINAPNVSLYASEIGYTSAPEGTNETIEQLVKDRGSVRYMMLRAIKEGKLTHAYYYSIDGSLGKFQPLSFEGDLDWWIEFGNEKLN